jgi:hypothetical protein
MYRPFDWAPLAEVDPLPGDPDSILYEAGRLRNMATEITSQVETLKKIATQQVGEGQYVEGLQTSAKEVAEKLETVRERYAKVSEYLYAWAPELEDFQTKTTRLLDKALDAERQRARDPHADLQTTGFTYLGIHSTGMPETRPTDPAEMLLAEARRELHVLLEEAADRDRHWGSLISQAIDDKLTDGWRDHLHQLIEHHKGLIMGFTQGLGYLTTAVALASIAFPPLMGVTVGLTAANLMVHTVEYEGGEASLVDIGLDVFALLSFGKAIQVSAKLEHTFESTRLAASEAARGAATQSRREATAMARKDAEDIYNGLKEGDVDLAQKTLRRLSGDELKAGNDAARQVLEAPSGWAGFWRSVAGGSREDAHLIHDTRGLLAKYSEDAAVKKAGSHLGQQVLEQRVNFIPAAVTDLHDKFAIHAPFAKVHAAGYNEWKERYVMGGGPLE